MSKKIDEKITNIILEELNHLKIDFIYIFGSYAQGKNREDSDLDIAFYSNEKYDEYKLFLIKNELSKKLKKEIDLVQLKESSTVFQKEVISKGTVIYEKNEINRQKFEMIVMKKYMKLNQERSEIIENYKVD
ncbi:MAG: type VII toxin-antitoxin system MntA family adenylyltransferase antitoxin [Fusobacteriota bacterium]